MGTANISGIGKGYAQGQEVGNSSDVRKEEEKINFLDLMSQMTVQPETELFSGDGNDDGGEIRLREKSQSVTDRYDRYRYREQNVRDGKPAMAADDETVTEELSEYAKEVKEALKEELGVTDEQIQEAMEALGLSVADFMNPNLLAELAAKLTGCENVSELLCNSDFMAVMQTVNELTEKLLNELGISMEELTQMVEQMQNVTGKEITDSQEIQLQDASQLDSAMAQEENNPNIPAESSNLEEAMQSEDVSDKRGQNETVEEPQMTEQDEKNMQMAELTGFKDGQSSQNSQMQDGSSQNALPGQNQTEIPVTQGQAVPTEPVSQVDVTDIIRQITEFTRITVGKAATTMEMQLNPEHLGKLYLEITAKAGAVSAHITTQNEIVKEALEAQLVELKETLNQAGVKVDAVEVSVGSHEFERNLEQNAKQQERQAEEQERMAKQTRHINLNNLDELSGLMSEEESLVAQMMAEQGNTIDFTA